MKNKLVNKFVTLFIIYVFSTSMVSEYSNIDLNLVEDTLKPIYPLYNKVVGTYYNAVEAQTNDNPHITGSGFIINPKNASELRIIAISQNMLNSKFRAKLIEDNPDDNRFRGKIQYGDTVYIKSRYEKLNGYWVVRDAMNKRYNNRIDFLLSEGDLSLSEGVFYDIVIYDINDARVIGLDS